MKKISSFEYAVTLATVFLGSYIQVNGFIAENGQSSPLLSMFWCALLVPCLLLYLKSFRFGTLFEFKNKQGEKVIYWLYILFFVFLAAYNVNTLASFIKTYILPKTPKYFFVLLFTLLCAFAASDGGKGVLKLSAAFFFTGALSEIVSTFMLREKLMLDTLLSFGEGNNILAWRNVLSGALMLSAEITAVNAFVPLNDKSKKKALWTGCTAGVFFLLLLIFRSVAALGNTSKIFTWPTFEALRMALSRNNLSRIETTSAFVILSMVIFKVSLFFASAAEGVKKLCPNIKNKLSLFVISVLVFSLGCPDFLSGEALLSSTMKWGIFVTLPFALIFPLYFSLNKRK